MLCFYRNTKPFIVINAELLIVEVVNQWSANTSEV